MRPALCGGRSGALDGYSQEDFDGLLNLLEKIKGKFLLSSFRNKALTEAAKRNGWHTLEFRMPSSMAHGHITQRAEIEVLTANYPIKAPDKVSEKAERNKFEKFQTSI